MNGQPQTADIVGVILAGGRSLRMGGGDKCLLEIAGRPLLSHAIERLRPQVATLVLNANGDLSRFDAFGLPVAPDRDADFRGPLAGILAGMDWTRMHMPGANFVATAAADTPFFPRDLVARLAASLDGKSRIAIALSGGCNHPVFALFPLELRSDLAAFLSQSPRLAVTAWIERHPWKAVEFEVPAIGFDPFFNINEPDDLSLVQSKIVTNGFY